MKLIMTVDVMVSNKDILTSLENSLELQYALNRRVSFISEDIGAAKAMLTDLKEVVFNYVRIHSKSGIAVFIYDHDGLMYYKQDSTGKETYYDDIDPEYRSYFSSENIVEEMTGYVEIESLIQDDFSEINDGSLWNRPIPDGTRFTKAEGSDYVQFHVIDKIEPVKKLSYMYHCNESNYESYNIYQGIGVLYLDHISGNPDRPLLYNQINSAFEIINSEYDLPEEFTSFLREQCLRTSNIDDIKTETVSAFEIPSDVINDLMEMISIKSKPRTVKPTSIEKINTALDKVKLKHDLPEYLLNYIREQHSITNDMRNTLITKFNMCTEVSDDITGIVDSIIEIIKDY